MQNAMENNDNLSEDQMTQNPNPEEEILEPQDVATETEENPTTEEVPTIEQEAEEWKNKFLRSVAEFDNYKKRTNKEIADIIQAGGKSVIKAMLEVMDDVDRAEQQIDNSEDVAVIKEGIQLVFQKLRNTMKAQGVEGFDSKGEDFDVELHDAITEIPAPDESMKGKVVDEIEKGYNLNGKLLRHAKVVVGK